MRLSLLLTLCLSCAGLVQAQPATPTPSDAQPAPAPRTGQAIEKRAERIRVEDNGARIDELRIGGETQTIEVQPKGGMPAYQIQPTSGERSWKVLGF